MVSFGSQSHLWSRVTGSVGSSLCSMSGGLQVIDRQVLCGGHVVHQKDFTCSKAFLPVIRPSLSPGLGYCVSLRLRLLNLMLTRIMLCDAQRKCCNAARLLLSVRKAV